MGAVMQAAEGNAALTTDEFERSGARRMTLWSQVEESRSFPLSPVAEERRRR